MRLVLSIALVVAASCAAATPPTQSLPSAVASAPGVTPAEPTPSPSRAATYQVWAEETGSRLAFSDLGLTRPQNRTAPPAADCFIFTCASGQPLGVANTDIALLPDGRLRMYLLGPGESEPALLSAVSSDGLKWTAEPGTRCQLFVCSGGQPGIAALPSGGWRIFFNHPDGFYSAVTQDGFTFTADPGVRLRKSDFPVNPAWEITGAHVVMAKEGGWRLYFSERFAGKPEPGPRPRVFSAHSSDLLNWTPDPGVRVPDAIRPFVLRRKDGTYQMFAVNMAQPTGIGGCACIVTGTSDDGLSWSAMRSTGLEGGDPSAYLTPDGEVRLYYNDGDFYPPGGDDRVFSARPVTVPWGVSIDRRPSSPGGMMIERVHITLQVLGSGPPVTVRLMDRTRELPRTATGLPYTARPPFQVEFDMQPPPQIQLDELIQVTDGSAIRMFEALGDAALEPRP